MGYFDEKNLAVSKLIEQLTYRRNKNSTIGLKGHYAGVFKIGNFYGALKTDGVGTKLMIANELKKFDTVGIDCVAMNVNDLITLGLEPISMVDYIAVDSADRLKDGVAISIGKGLNDGAKLANIEIIGGETAVLSGIVNGIDLSGAAFGMSNKLVTGEKIKENDIIIGLHSSGIHSNGYSLVRKIINDNNISLNEKFDNKTIGDELLIPTTIYVKEVLEIADKVHGMAHITGGGLRNLIRLSENYSFNICAPIKPNKIFEFLRKEGNISDEDMYQTFNMGMGFCLIAPDKGRIIENILEATRKYNPQVVGYIEKGHGVFVKELNINYNKY
ncbi:MAG: phosphoribosylformylglycinamidine cyclo-ligase [Candidatus Micrarchaeia archaeon]